jgi:hypothetical protein
MSAARKRLFFEKKNQKTYFTPGFARPEASAQNNKNFLLLFFKKEVLA